MSQSWRDIFICHASEDKSEVVRPLFEALTEAEISCWYDEAEIKWGDSITEKINEGIGRSTYVVVVFSPAFMEKNWPQRELNAVLNQEAASGRVKVLPLLVGSEEEKRTILSRYPLLNDKRYLPWDGDLRGIVDALRLRLGREKKTGNREMRPSASLGLRIPLPNIKRQFSQRDKDMFVRNSFSVVKDYFRKGLKELEFHYKEIETDFAGVHNFKFVCTIYVRGAVANRCKIWLGGLSSNDAIAYQTGQFNIDSDNSYNEILSITEDGQVLGFSPMMGSYNTTQKLFAPEEGAEYLWRRFTENLG